MAGQVIRNSAGIEEVLRAACARRELLIFVTPYLKVESNFVRLDGHELHVAATMSRDDAVYGLKSPELRIRFPHGTVFLEGRLELKGFGMHEGRRTLRLSLPTALNEDELRGAYRVERVGKITCTWSTRKFDLQTASLVNISTTGGRLHASKDFSGDDLRVGDEVSVTIPLTDSIRINSLARIRHLQLRTFGLEFRPPLEGELLTHLSRWIFQKREEDRDRESRRGVEGVKPEVMRPLAGEVPHGLALVGGDEALEAQLKESLDPLQPVTRYARAGGQALKDALTANPALLIIPVGDLGLDARRRLKTMLEGLSQKRPFVLLGTGVDQSQLMELGHEAKAACVYQFSAQRGLFFQRLIQGVLRRHGTDIGTVEES